LSGDATRPELFDWFGGHSCREAPGSTACFVQIVLHSGDFLIQSRGLDFPLLFWDDVRGGVEVLLLCPLNLVISKLARTEAAPAKTDHIKCQGLIPYSESGIEGFQLAWNIRIIQTVV
jgi:hypothetical protein